jgi:hypothetical protein
MRMQIILINCVIFLQQGRFRHRCASVRHSLSTIGRRA